MTLSITHLSSDLKIVHKEREGRVPGRISPVIEENLARSKGKRYGGTLKCSGFREGAF
jgi:hypothetical protein